jgi:hypothetical protein
MQSTLNPKQTDDPHDFVVVPPDVARVVPPDEELSNLLHKAARQQTRAAPDALAGPTVPPLDATFRPAVNDVRVAGKGLSMAKRALRAFLALLLAACIGLAAVAWRSYGETAKKQIAKLATQFLMTSSLPAEKPGVAAQPAAPAVEADAANPAPPQPAAPDQNAAEAAAPAAPSAESAQLIQSMARDLATLGQEVEQLKAGMEELKANQQQMFRELAKVSEQNSRPKTSAVSAPPARPAAARPRKPIASYPAAQAAAAPGLPQTAQPYVPRQPEYAPRAIEPPPQATVEPQADPELLSVPRPPMPVR